VTNHADPSESEPLTIADLAADAADVQDLLHLGGVTLRLPDHGTHVRPDGAIPESALALVAGLDAYGD
jgi:hypothetical protein